MSEKRSSKTRQSKEQQTKDNKSEKTFAHPDVSQVAKRDNVIFFKANRPLKQAEHEQLSSKIRYEMKETGLNIVLVPFSVDVEFKE